MQSKIYIGNSNTALFIHPMKDVILKLNIQQFYYYDIENMFSDII